MPLTFWFSLHVCTKIKCASSILYPDHLIVRTHGFTIYYTLLSTSVTVKKTTQDIILRSKLIYIQYHQIGNKQRSVLLTCLTFPSFYQVSVEESPDVVGHTVHLTACKSLLRTRKVTNKK